VSVLCVLVVCYGLRVESVSQVAVGSRVLSHGCVEVVEDKAPHGGQRLFNFASSLYIRNVDFDTSSFKLQAYNFLCLASERRPYRQGRSSSMRRTSSACAVSISRICSPRPSIHRRWTSIGRLIMCLRDLLGGYLRSPAGIPHLRKYGLGLLIWIRIYFDFLTRKTCPSLRPLRLAREGQPLKSRGAPNQLVNCVQAGFVVSQFQPVSAVSGPIHTPDWITALYRQNRYDTSLLFRVLLRRAGTCVP
jgi:hypothetical protein